MPPELGIHLPETNVSRDQGVPTSVLAADASRWLTRYLSMLSDTTKNACQPKTSNSRLIRTSCSVFRCATETYLFCFSSLSFARLATDAVRVGNRCLRNKYCSWSGLSRKCWHYQRIVTAVELCSRAWWQYKTSSSVSPTFNLTNVSDTVAAWNTFWNSIK